MNRVILPAALALLVGAAPALAAEHTITQEGKKFSEKKITIGVGDTINFVNNDKTTHNVHSRSKSGAFDLGAQKPGQSSAHTFAEKGKYKVRCAIHPKMKITINVE